jgi:hypothetical protein
VQATGQTLSEKDQVSLLVRPKTEAPFDVQAASQAASEAESLAQACEYFSRGHFSHSRRFFSSVPLASGRLITVQVLIATTIGSGKCNGTD